MKPRSTIGCLSIAALLALAFAPGGPAVAQPSPPRATPPIFDFQGADTDRPADIGAVKGCGAEADGVLQCEDRGNPVVAGTKARSILEKFNNKRLYYVYGSFEKSAYPALLAAFTGKYVQPEKTLTVKGRDGADHTVAIWEFKGGNLHLDSVGQDANSGAFEFQDDTDLPAAQQQRIDF